ETGTRQHQFSLRFFQLGFSQGEFIFGNYVAVGQRFGILIFDFGEIHLCVRLLLLRFENYRQNLEQKLPFPDKLTFVYVDFLQTSTRLWSQYDRVNVMDLSYVSSGNEGIFS